MLLSSFQKNSFSCLIPYHKLRVSANANLRMMTGRRTFATTVGGGGLGRGPVTWSGFLVSTVVAGGVVYYYQVEKERLQTLIATKQTTVGKPSLGGPWTLVRTDGTPVTDGSYRGKFQLLYFGFTRCPDICPSELVKVGSVLDQVSFFDRYLEI